MYDIHDTIAAVSTAPGPAARAIVRLSGPEAISLAAGTFASHGTPLDRLGGFRTVSGQVICPQVAAPSIAYVFRSPRSYTRQDLVELHIPGHPSIGRMLVAALIAAGARQAGPGEFTRRGLLTGRIDLSAAEAVAGMITAATDAELRAAEVNAAGALHALCRSWAGEIAEALAEVEASIDVAEEGLELTAPAALATEMVALAARMGEAVDRAAVPPAASEIPTVVMAGAPNVGKSSLMNALTGLDRAIVSATAGTTRDVLTAPLALGPGREVLLVDLAGFAPGGDRIAAAADAAARTALAGADLILVILDATNPDRAALDLAAGRNGDVLVALNKADLAPGGGVPPITDLPIIATSAVTGEGLDVLMERLGRTLTTEAAPAASPCAMHQRQREAIGRSCAALIDAAEHMAPLSHLADRAELLAVDLRGALAELGTITGDAISEEVLGRIFQRFCVGK